MVDWYTNWYDIFYFYFLLCPLFIVYLGIESGWMNEMLQNEKFPRFFPICAISDWIEINVWSAADNIADELSELSVRLKHQLVISDIGINRKFFKIIFSKNVRKFLSLIVLIFLNFL